MKTKPLETYLPNVRLINPDVNRDADLSVTWLKGTSGRDTLRLMGVNNTDNHETTLEKERARMHEFITGTDEFNWMIELDGRVIGSIWVDLIDKGTLPAPAVHIMIGDPKARGKGVGNAALQTVLGYLKDNGHNKIYSRYLVANTIASHLLETNGFHIEGKSYVDGDGLSWQNVSLNTG